MHPFEKIVSGEIAGSATAAQMPDIACRAVKFKAVIGNAGNVYVGGVNDTTKATLTTNLTGANNDVVYTAVQPGLRGNRVSVEYLDPGANDAALAVTVDASDPHAPVISVSLATGGAGAITSTADEVKAAIEAAADAAALVTVADAGGNDGSGVVTAMAAANLAGGGLGVTKVDGTTDATSGWELDAGEETDWIPVSNLSRLCRICDNAGDDLVYMALVS